MEYKDTAYIINGHTFKTTEESKKSMQKGNDMAEYNMLFRHLTKLMEGKHYFLSLMQQKFLSQGDPLTFDRRRVLLDMYPPVTPYREYK